MKQPVQLELFSIPALSIDDAFGEEMIPTIVKHFQDRRTLITHMVIHPNTLSKHIPNMQDRQTWDFGHFDVAVNRKRMKTFMRSNKCSCCGREGNVFVVEEATNDQLNRKYLNMYHVSAEGAIEMTVDHTLPQSFGGADTHHNRETMCFVCNQGKANIMGHKEIDKVLLNVKRYVKDWVNVAYITSLLKLHKIMLDQNNPAASRQLKGALNKYLYVVQSGTKQSTYDRLHTQLLAQINTLTKSKTPPAPEPVVVKSNWFDNVVSYIRKMIGA